MSLDLESLPCNSLQRNPAWSLLIYSTGDGEKASEEDKIESRKEKPIVVMLNASFTQQIYLNNFSFFMISNSSNFPNRRNRE